MRLASVRNKLASALRQTRAGTEAYRYLMDAFLDLDEAEGEAIRRVHERWTTEGQTSLLCFLERSPSGRLKQCYRRGRLPPGLAYQEEVEPGA